MADDTQTTTTDDRNPLDVLEELLKNDGDAAAKGDADALAEDERLEKERAQKRQEFEAKQVMQQDIDAQKIADQKKLLETIKNTPEYQARVQQEQQQQEETKQVAAATEGFEITQLTHDKV